ncbi:unnamed protein product, partial [Urochloa humidicola]
DCHFRELRAIADEAAALPPRADDATGESTLLDPIVAAVQPSSSRLLPDASSRPRSIRDPLLLAVPLQQ